MEDATLSRSAPSRRQADQVNLIATRCDRNDANEGDASKGHDGASQNERSTRVVALDSTGLFLSYSSRYFRWRAKRERGQRGWLKWALALWVEPQML